MYRLFTKNAVQLKSSLLELHVARFGGKRLMVGNKVVCEMPEGVIRHASEWHRQQPIFFKYISGNNRTAEVVIPQNRPAPPVQRHQSPRRTRREMHQL